MVYAHNSIDMFAHITIVVERPFPDVANILSMLRKHSKLVWYGMVWFGMARYGRVGYGMVWYESTIPTYF